MNIRGDHSYNHGDQLVLNCSSEGSPNLEYTWLSPGNVTISTNTSTLIIYNITGSDGGEYTCNVTNNFGTDSNTITVHSELIACAATVEPACLYYGHLKTSYIAKIVQIIKVHVP